MRSTFIVKDCEYEIALEKLERSEGDKFNPYSVLVSVQGDTKLQGTCQVTDEALKMVGEQATAIGTSAGELLAQACAKSLASELVIRKLKPEFSFVVDHRWIV